MDGAGMIELMRELYPIPRSLTGDGVRQTLARISQEVPLEITEVPTGTQVFDWTVPREWNVDEAWIADADGNRVVDFAESSLHLLGYSVPVRERLSLAELRERVFTHRREPGLDPVSHLVLHRELGLLPLAAPARRARGRRVRGLRRARGSRTATSPTARR